MSKNPHPENHSQSSKSENKHNLSSEEGFFATIAATTSIGAAIGNVFGAFIGLCAGIAIFFTYKAWKHFKAGSANGKVAKEDIEELKTYAESSTQTMLNNNEEALQTFSKESKCVATQRPSAHFFKGKRARLEQKTYSVNLKMAG